MQRIEIIHGVVLGNGKHGHTGEIHEVEDSVARVLFHAHQARVAPAPVRPVPPAAPTKEPLPPVAAEPKRTYNRKESVG